MDTGASNTQKDAQVPRRPSRSFRFAVGAVFVLFLFQQSIQDHLKLVLLRLFLVLLRLMTSAHNDDFVSGYSDRNLGK